MRVSQRAKHARLQVGRDGELTVIVPSRFDHCEIPQIVHTHRAWIDRTRARIRKGIEADSAPAEPTLPEAIDLPAISQRWTVTYEPGPGAAVSAQERSHQELLVSGHLSQPRLVHAVLRRWLTKQAEQTLVPLLDEIAEEYGFTFSRATIRSQRTRWGSCSKRGSISLNSQLLLIERDLVRYVLIHELAHTRHLDHSHKFWRAVEQIEPDCIRLRARLATASRSLPPWIRYP